LVGIRKLKYLPAYTSFTK